MPYFKTVFFLIISLRLISCKEGEYNNDSVLHTSTVGKSETIDIEDSQSNVGRAIWQKPGLVIEKLGNISDKIIADIGAGNGYFSLRLAYKAKKVIAIEIDEKFLAHIDSVKVRLPKEFQSKIETRLAVPNDPGLEKGEVDIILIIN
ncbi:MAG: methyltransferase, partial [Saprospiraceae bacterium]|nr:methyltransferase [Saprospiraceae bacterium]